MGLSILAAGPATIDTTPTARGCVRTVERRLPLQTTTGSEVTADRSVPAVRLAKAAVDCPFHCKARLRWELDPRTLRRIASAARAGQLRLPDLVSASLRNDSAVPEMTARPSLGDTALGVATPRPTLESAAGFVLTFDTLRRHHLSGSRTAHPVRPKRIDEGEAAGRSARLPARRGSRLGVSDLTLSPSGSSCHQTG